MTATRQTDLIIAFAIIAIWLIVTVLVLVPAANCDCRDKAKMMSTES